MRGTILAISFLVGVFLAGCGGQQTEQPSEERPTTQSERVEETNPERTANETTAANPGAIVCSNFTVQVQAQGYYDEIATESQRATLDPDGDGIACEELPQTPPE